MKKHLVKILLGLIALLGGYTAIDNFGGGTGSTNNVIIFDEISATTTSSSINIDGADRVTLAFTVADLAESGVATSTFVVTVSNDDTNYVTFNKLVDNVTSSNSQQLTRVDSIAIDSNSTKVYSLDLQHHNFMFLKVTDTITGTTTSFVTLKALIED